jgi:hypothetical protein
MASFEIMPGQAEIYRAAMRLIELHGDAAEMAAVLRADPLIQHDEGIRQGIINAIAHLRSLGVGSKPN